MRRRVCHQKFAVCVYVSENKCHAYFFNERRQPKKTTVPQGTPPMRQRCQRCFLALRAVAEGCRTREGSSSKEAIGVRVLQWVHERRAKKPGVRFELRKFNFASGFYHCRFCIRRFSTTIYNALFVSGVFDLSNGVRPVRPARFLGYEAVSLVFFFGSPSRDDKGRREGEQGARQALNTQWALNVQTGCE